MAKILVLEGNEVSALAAKFVLEGREVDVCATTCVETFCSLAETGDFDIVIIGEMPDEKSDDVRRIIETLWVLQESTDISSVVINFSDRTDMNRIASISVPRSLGLSLLIDAVNRVIDECAADPLRQNGKE